MIPSTEQVVDDLTLGEMLTAAHRGQVDYFVQGGVSVSKSSSVRFDGSGQPGGETVDRSGQPDERNSSKAQIRTLLEEQRQIILAECHARVSQHEFQAARAGEEQRLLQDQLVQQKLEFREFHQRNLTEMEELRKFQSSAFDTMARRKFIEDQNTFFFCKRPSRKTRVTGIPNHFSSGWGWTIKSLGSTILQERLGEGPRTRAS